MTTDSFQPNGTVAWGQQDEDGGSRVFNITLIALSLCVLTITGLYAITVCYSRTRQSKRAHMYESAVSQCEPVDPVAVRAVKRSSSFTNPLTFFRKQEAAKDNSRIYYIYSNPLPVGLKEEEEQRRQKAAQDSEEQAALSLTPSLQEYARDPNSGVTLDPPVFYMQL
ncbi:uncharacterized protein si:dkey-246e1.3 isoform X2 [Betta splendens]|uniref:Uncharacterized protein si:dkey-246e1.3 isoform X2 n=1 Tax=Betta splendens TaxID=158456 RepID=A0A8M1HGJ0_BETSP|nr:uncharacterized protein si:dkey-246e1.3 isoform X2 [Betta splendens]